MGVGAGVAVEMKLREWIKNWRRQPPEPPRRICFDPALILPGYSVVITPANGPDLVILERDTFDEIMAGSRWKCRLMPIK